MASSIFRSMAVRGSSCIKGSYSSRSYSVAYLPKMSVSRCPCSLNEKLVHSNGYSNAAANHGSDSEDSERRKEEEVVPTEGISRPMSEVLKELNKKVPESLIKVRSEDGFAIKYVPWHIVNRIMNLHAPEWSGEVRNITYSPDGKSVTVVYRVTLHGTDAEISRESTGTASVDDKGFGDAVQKAEGMAFRRACARLGLGLHLYHEDMS